MPWSREAAKAQVSESASGGSIEPKKDLKVVAETFAKTSTDPATKDKWERLVNSLSQLEAIEITRGLNAEENKIRDDIMKEIANASSNLNTLAINAPPYAPPLAKPPKPAPATAADIAALLAQFQQGQVQQPPGLNIHMPPQQQPQPQPQPQLQPLPVISKIGPPSNAAAEVKLDYHANLALFENLIDATYSQKYPTRAVANAWEFAILQFDPNYKSFKIPTRLGREGEFPKWILKGVEKDPIKSEIFVAYLVDKTATPNMNALLKDEFTLSKIAKASANKEFFYNPNYKLA